MVQDVHFVLIKLFPIKFFIFDKNLIYGSGCTLRARRHSVRRGQEPQVRIPWQDGGPVAQGIRLEL